MLLAAFAIPVGWYLSAGRRGRHRVRGLVDLPYAIPGVVLAIACILLFLRPLPLIGSLYATAWIILIAYLMRFFTLALKPVGRRSPRFPPHSTKRRL